MLQHMKLLSNDTVEPWLFYPCPQLSRMMSGNFLKVIPNCCVRDPLFAVLTWIHM